MIDSWDGEPDSSFDADFAEGFIGRTLLVGVTTIGAEGGVARQEQVYGVIVGASAFGVDVELHGAREGAVWRMPPFLDELTVASPGTYRLRATGESVVNPDFLFSLTIRSDGQH